MAGTISITSPTGTVTLAPNPAGGYYLPNARGSATPCIEGSEVYAFVYNDTSLMADTPDAGARKVTLPDSNNSWPQSPYCQMMTSYWYLAAIPGATVGTLNFLRVWIKFKNESAYTHADSTFTGVLSPGWPTPPAPAPNPPTILAAAAPAPPVPGALAAPLPSYWDFRIVSTTVFPFPHNLCQLGGLLAFSTQRLGYDFGGSGDIWTVGDPHTGPHWRLELLGGGFATLRLRLNLGFVLEENWTCPTFDSALGGSFEPDIANLIKQPIEVL